MRCGAARTATASCSTVADDGRGFDARRPASAAARGTSACALLRDLARDARRPARRSSRARRAGRACELEVPADVIRVLIADDHAVVRAGLSSCSARADDVEVVGVAGRRRRGGRARRRSAPDVVLMDLSMPGSTGSRRRGGSLAERPERASWC